MIDKATADKIANIYYDDVYSYCFSKLKDKYVAEDITQDAFLVFQLKTDKLVDDHIIAWLINTASNLIKAYFRENSRFIREELKESHLSVNDIIECMERENPITPEELDDQIQQILNALNEKERVFFTKRYIEHKTQKEIAAEMNMSENATKVYYSRLRVKIIEEAKIITGAWILLVARMFFGNF